MTIAFPPLRCTCSDTQPDSIRHMRPCPLHQVPDFEKMYLEMGAALVGEMCCGRCGKRHDVTAERAAEHLKHGWPECCGVTMAFLSKKRVEKGK